MTTQVDTIQCTSCSAKFKVKRLHVASVAACPKCKNEIALAGTGGTSVEMVKSMPFDDLPPPVEITDRVRPPRRKLLKPLVGAIASKRQAVAPALILLVVTATAIAVGAAVYSNRDKIRRDVSKNLFPGKDSREQLIVDHEQMVANLIQTIDSANDTNSRNKTIVELRAFNRGFQNLTSRAVSMGPMNESDFSTMQAWFEEQISDRSAEVNQSCGKLLSKRMLTGTVLQQALADIVNSDRQFTKAIQTAWTPIPRPTSESENLAYQMKEIRFRVWGSVASASNPSDFSELGSVFESAAAELESILVKYFADKTDVSHSIVSQDETEDLEIESSKYRDELLAQTQSRMTWLESKYESTNRVSFKRYVDSVNALDNARVK